MAGECPSKAPRGSISRLRLSVPYAILRSMNSLREARRGTGKTLKTTAEEARISIGALSQYETGKVDPRPPIRAAIAQALGLAEDDIDWNVR